MTDRELLELAAKAAGHELVWCNDDDDNPECYVFCLKPGSTNRIWNPLTDDGDARGWR